MLRLLYCSVLMNVSFLFSPKFNLWDWRLTCSLKKLLISLYFPDYVSGQSLFFVHL